MTDTSRPLVSIGLPTYNRPELLRRALTELVNQSYTNLEIIVADNASPGPEVGAVMAAFTAGDGRVKYFRHAENMGMAYNWQFVLEKASGKYYVQASDDDRRDPDFVSELVALLEAEPAAALAFCEHQAVDVENRPQPGYGPHFEALRRLGTPGARLRQARFFLQDEKAGKSNLIYGLVRREHLRDFKWSEFNGRYGLQGSDVLFGFRLICRGPLAVSPRTLFYSCVGNVKTYSAEAPAGFFSRILSHIGTMGRYSFQYHKIAGGAMRWALLALWPVKMFLVAYAMVENKVSLVLGQRRGPG